MQAKRAEEERMQAKLWLALYCLKKFGIEKLKMGAEIGDNPATRARENQE